jgi:superfamily II DNA or RNA helicase
MILRDYQQEAVDFLVPRRRAFVQAPAGSGKTVMGAAAVSRVVSPGKKVIWLTGTKELVDQGIAAIQSTPGPEGVEFQVCCVAAQPDTSPYDVIVFDECAHLPAQSWIALFNAAKPAAIIWGFSATPYADNDPERNAVLDTCFPERFVVERERLQDLGHVLRGDVIFHDIDRPGEFDEDIAQKTSVEVIRRCRRFPMVPRWEHLRRCQWQATLDCLKENRTRNAHVCGTANEAARRGESVLVLVQSIEHGQELVAQMPNSVLAFSKMGKKARKEAIDRFRSGDLKILVGTQLCDEGVDIPRASVLVLAAGGRASGKVIQRTGRVLRPFPGKECGVIHDYADNGATFASAQARAREKVYLKLGYTVRTVKE